jgi:hypothetical protein
VDLRKGSSPPSFFLFFWWFGFIARANTVVQPAEEGLRSWSYWGNGGCGAQWSIPKRGHGPEAGATTAVEFK